MKSKPVLPACSTNIPSLPADGDGGAIRKGNQDAGAASQRVEIEQAEARTERAERRTEEARSRTEAAETRTEQAESRTELAKTRTEQAENRTERAEMRTEQVETILQRVIDSRIAARPEISAGLQKALPMPGNADEKGPILTINETAARNPPTHRRRPEHQANRRHLKLSPKTVEYHRMKLMNRLNIHDVPGLVRFALRVGLIPPEG